MPCAWSVPEGRLCDPRQTRFHVSWQDWHDETMRADQYDGDEIEGAEKAIAWGRRDPTSFSSGSPIPRSRIFRLARRSIRRIPPGRRHQSQQVAGGCRPTPTTMARIWTEAWASVRECHLSGYGSQRVLPATQSGEVCIDVLIRATRPSSPKQMYRKSGNSTG
jgi:hypothetical protein